jgi:hypothetical protein
VIRSVAVRLLSLSVALLAMLGGPGSALAHGFAHHESAEHAHHYDVGVRAGEQAIGADDHAAEHGHGALDPAACARAVQSAIAVPGLTVIHPVVSTIAVAEPPTPGADESPPDTPGVPPPSSRAPPAL